MSNSSGDIQADDSYFTISTKSEGMLKEKSSKFHYFAFPVSSEEAIKTHLAELRKAYYDARHHCFAWVLGKDGDLYRANDDGEPNHSAGDPILGQIRSNNLTNILIVVVRYFGGTKLGLSGLIQAYRSAAALAIESSEIIEEQVMAELRLKFPYPVMDQVMRLVKQYDIQIVEQEMELDCKMSLALREGLRNQLEEALENIEQLEIFKD